MNRCVFRIVYDGGRFLMISKTANGNKKHEDLSLADVVRLLMVDTQQADFEFNTAIPIDPAENSAKPAAPKTPKPKASKSKSKAKKPAAKKK